VRRNAWNVAQSSRRGWTPTPCWTQPLYMWVHRCWPLNVAQGQKHRSAVVTSVRNRRAADFKLLLMWQGLARHSSAHALAAAELQEIQLASEMGARLRWLLEQVT
jgi:hypothetical protein